MQNPAYQFGWLCNLHRAVGRGDDDSLGAHQDAEHDGQQIAVTVITHEGACPGYDGRGRCHCREPQLCLCGQWCIYDGWDHVHANGLGLDEPTAHKEKS